MEDKSAVRYYCDARLRHINESHSKNERNVIKSCSSKRISQISIIVIIIIVYHQLSTALCLALLLSNRKGGRENDYDGLYSFTPSQNP